MLKFQSEIEFIKNLYGNKDFIPLHEPLFIGNEKKYVLETIDSTFVSSVGKYVDLFEEKIKNYTGAKHAIAVVNGTAALHMSLILAGVKQNDIVITQALSFVATCNAISYLGAKPTFIDVDNKTLGLSFNALCNFLESVELRNDIPYHITSNKRIGACVPMHTFGFPLEIDKIISKCNEYNIPVIEDAAESLGSTYKGKHTGTFGLLGTYSFNGNKTITSGGGGIIVTNNDELGLLAKHLTTQAKVPHKWEYVHNHIGYNYRCPNINAALACAQIEQLENFIISKRKTSIIYQEYFNTNDQITFVNEPINSKSNYWLNAILLNNKNERDLFLEETNTNGVMTRPVWKLINKLKMYENCIHDGLINSNEIESRLVNIPSSVIL
jgi:perosamine synthetase